ILAAALVSLIADNRIGGQTGDVLGATQQAGEIAALMALVAVLPA
ncbi:MAG TPA: adenosylcobinamide-GDP ribazoletransferase, partial [Rhodobacteraceae bacterium]|nr:adenosylcobinamide-GDP ribazoletransferase [Paracoccaceae bacterium]